MFLLALLLFLLAIGGCLIAIRKSLDALGVSVVEAMAWLGLAETPVVQTRRRRV